MDELIETGQLSCGECGAPMVLRITERFLNKDGSPKKFYGCTRYPDCKGTHAAHQSTGFPMGVPADKETKEWRSKAHEEFDKLWKKWGYERLEAYKLLQTIMSMTEKEAHIANFTKEQCQLLIEKLKKT